MNENLKMKARSLPLSPGVYLMRDKSGTILYIGKAKKLKERVSSYFINNKSHSTKVKRMLLHLDHFDVIHTNTELDALLLECRLIQKHRPMYNRQMNAFERYNYMNISTENGAVHLSVTPLPEEDYSFGPYTSYRRLPEIKEVLEKLYGLKPNKLWQQLYDQPADPENTETIIEEVLAAFSGHSQLVEGRIERKMLEFSEQLRFIQAAQWRDDWTLIQYFFKKHAQLLLHPLSQREWHALWLPTDAGKKCYLIYQGLITAEKEFPGLKTKNKRELTKLSRKLIPDKIEAFDTFSKEQIDFINILYIYLQKVDDYQLLSLKK